jgi:hypothetical protein
VSDSNRKGGTISFQLDGVQQDAKGNFSVNPGVPKTEPIIGSDGTVHGYKEVPQVPEIEGEITDRPDLDVKKLMRLRNVTVSLDLANGKGWVGHEMWFAAEGKIQTDEGNIAVKFQGRHELEEVAV